MLTASLGRVALTVDGNSKFGRAVKRLMMFVMPKFMISLLGQFDSYRRCVFKSEDKTQWGFVLLMLEIENH